MCALPVKNALERLRKSGDFRAFVDTCFLLDEKAVAVLDNEIFKLLHSWECPAVITHSVATELKKHANGTAKPELVSSAKQALALLAKHKKEDRIRLLGASSDHFADQNFIEVFTRFRPKYNLILFTNDRALQRDLLRLNEIESTSNYKTRVWVAWNTGKGIVATEQINPETTRVVNHAGRAISSKRVQLFSVHKKIRKLDETLVGGEQRFRTGDVLYMASGTRVTLLEPLTPGGEAQPFITEGGDVAKVYHPSRRSVWRIEKLSMMCERRLDLACVAWPKAVLYGSDKLIVGCLLPKVEGRPMQDVLFSKEDLLMNFPHWNRLSLTRVARDIATLVSELNRRGVIVGDLHPNNFLVDRNGEVSIVDIDGAQIEDFPCEVGLPIFKAPEITSESYRQFLRNEQHEAFALASLLFMILMGGKAPFSFQGGGDPSENIRAANFPYVKNQGAIPAGAYRYIWSHFPPSIQAAFEQAFTSNDPSERPTTHMWRQVLDRYCGFLESPRDLDSLRIWPTDFRSRGNKDKISLRCEECGGVFNATIEDAKKRRAFPRMLCNTCIPILALARKSGENHTCKNCRKLFSVAFGKVEKHGAVLEVCDECVTQIAAQPRRCKNCTRMYTLEFGEVQSFLAKGLHLPKKCGPCRGKPATTITQARPQFEMRKLNPSPNPSPSSPEPSSIWGMLKSLFD